MDNESAIRRAWRRVFGTTRQAGSVDLLESLWRRASRDASTALKSVAFIVVDSLLGVTILKWVGGVEAIIVVVGLAMMLVVFCLLRGLVSQRNEARAVVRRADRHLRMYFAAQDFQAMRGANQRVAAQIRDEGRDGSLPGDANPWVRSENEQLRLKLDQYGLAHLLTADPAPASLDLATWEDVDRESHALDRRLDHVITQLTAHPFGTQLPLMLAILEGQELPDLVWDQQDAP